VNWGQEFVPADDQRVMRSMSNQVKLGPAELVWRVDSAGWSLAGGAPQWRGIVDSIDQVRVPTSTKP